MNIFFVIWYIFQSWIAIYLALPFLFLLVYLFKKLSGTQYNINQRPTVFTRDFDFAAIITAHKDMRLVPALVDSILKQKYLNYIIYVVADGCDTVNLPLNQVNIVVLRPE